MTRSSRSGERDTVLFLSCWSTMGGAQVSLAAIMEALHGDLRTALAAPAMGPLVDRVTDRVCLDVHVVTPSFLDTSRPKARVGTALVLVRWLIRNHRRLAAVHANGDAEIKLLLPVLPLLFALRRPVVVWYHSREMSPGTLKLRLLWRVLGRRIRWATVSAAAREQLATAGVAASQVTVIPNPIDPGEISPPTPHRRSAEFVFGYLGCEYESKGITVLPGILDNLGDAPIRILCVTKEWPPERNSDAVNRALDRLRASGRVEIMPRDFDVRRIYARIDGLVVPSLSESFCRIAAEAMVIGLPVVASDIPAIREVTGEGSAALLFPAGDEAIAANQLSLIAADHELAARLVSAGRQIGQRFAPAAVAAALAQQYEIPSINAVGDEPRP